MRPTILLVVTTAVLLASESNYPKEAPPQQPSSQAAEALTGFDDQSNGFSDPSRRTADQKFFEEIEHIAPDGLGPIYNAQSCRECHQTPVSGAASQVSEFRAGHIDQHGFFQNPEVPINRGTEVIR